jgi:tripartite-type tricarboxylate transporter receptor subunit TctC
MKIVDAARRLALLALASIGWIGSAPLHAQGAATYPDKPIVIVVAYAAGGSADQRARQLGQELTRILGKPIVIDNKPGANGNIGTNVVAKAKPDGYTLGIGNFAPLATNIALFKSLPFDPLNDLVPIMAIERGPLVLMVPSTSPYKSLQELIDAARANPKGMSAANAGFGGSHHLSAEFLRQATGANIVHVAYKGGGPAATDLMGGNVDMMFELMYAAMPSIQTGKVRPLAITSKSRLASLPDLPTVSESALPGFEVLNWQGVIAPAGTPRDIVDKLNAAFNQALASPDVRQKIIGQGNEPLGGTPEEFGALIRSESQKWGDIIRKSGIKPE